eukprot:3332694-Pyramimonas_sp.AAC.1
MLMMGITCKLSSSLASGRQDTADLHCRQCRTVRRSAVRCGHPYDHILDKQAPTRGRKVENRFVITGFSEL